MVLSYDMLGITPILLTLISLANTDIPSTQRGLVLIMNTMRMLLVYIDSFFFRPHLNTNQYTSDDLAINQGIYQHDMYAACLPYSDPHCVVHSSKSQINMYSRAYRTQCWLKSVYIRPMLNQTNHV